ncbi:hypothetical protein A3D85_00400 [Candidatus Amesbacteria bacterium RIFCSPHIGHO2_02_FULL_47_9]|uniref:Uncharacterized protein n=1 Tax=Candidatus Amesbacteria bacterium RIFCSPHIGHO2_01_FULL_48_32b TaxID=1797253 RepID=A0A1F4YGX0_9BACT|nr:MAG: hypothetical protein A2876_01105 [Candidatus Amesbacteria bacterium RIFCSPHIGHO2_01_FULL_48_32b]OGD03539.1 MAG: hypothetical protein A3D85_00400 [Candidatus Amesbacteria bacterium RIFCSPHIGHO2_02_FULL_47_9]OGD07385.1 MAG: hypothetical protein A2899_03725 [Candidatus Amesbacteria bacterium RIFCSPLOWO2_01_FULL_49_25]
MFHAPADLTLAAIRQVEEEIMTICNSCKTVEQLHSADLPVWTWACQVLKKPFDDLRREIESHETDEKFPDLYSEEKDHLLKLPIVLLEHVNRHA